MSFAHMPRRCGYCGHAPCCCNPPSVAPPAQLDLKALMSATVHCFRYAPTARRDLGRVCDCHRTEADSLCACSCDGDVCACSCPGCLRAKRVDVTDAELTLLIMDNAAVFRERSEGRTL